ncbi:hypothetical protein OEZ85_003066 [Tetradesmus obliquus]|uniref:Uncharacterized protein n=1 Tax=Tetradesmus obliquus TaxID=3088 RepID=A0ABY8TZJ4_TETOB|nr:hypothetical protein OEZ85_003066 [Tetradesmus obliquus]
MQAALCRSQCHGAVLASSNQRVGRLRAGSIVRAGDDKGSKVVREYREDSGEMVVPGEQKKADNALYADQLPQALKPKENISKEMKQRLRQEYYGLGGSESKAMDSNYFLWIIVVISVLAVLSKLTGAI